MQGIYNFMSDTTRVTTVYSAADVLYLQFVLYAVLFRMFNTFCTYALALSRVRVQCRI